MNKNHPGFSRGAVCGCVEGCECVLPPCNPGPGRGFSLHLQVGLACRGLEDRMDSRMLGVDQSREEYDLAAVPGAGARNS